MLRLLSLSMLMIPLCVGFSQTPDSEDWADAVFRSVDVGGRYLRYLCIGEGTPTVIVEPGLGGQSIESAFSGVANNGWAAIVPEIAKLTRVCVYDRAGMGLSDRIASSRTSLDIATDLKALLGNVGIQPPYVFAGHSFGGMNSRVFADRYPDTVAGMILIDSTHPDLWLEWAAALPRPSADERAEFRALTAPPDLSQADEWIDLTTSADLVRATHGLGDMPLIVLTVREDYDDPDFPDDLERILRPIAFELQTRLVELSTNAELIVATSAGHNIHVDEPEIVMAAILDVVDRVRRSER